MNCVVTTIALGFHCSELSSIRLHFNAMNAMQCNECPCTSMSSITAPQAVGTFRADVLQYWWTQVCRGDLEADPPGPAFYKRPTIAADIFTTLPLLNYTSLSQGYCIHLYKSPTLKCDVPFLPVYLRCHKNLSVSICFRGNMDLVPA